MVGSGALSLVMPPLLRAVVAALVLFVAVAPSAAQTPVNCTTLGKNMFVRDVMTDLYFWYREVPTLNPARYDSPEAYLEALRYMRLDHSYSYITTRESSEAFFSESQFVGFGFGTEIVNGELRVLQVFSESPAAEAGLARGDRIQQIGGREVSALIASGDIDDAFGPSTLGFSLEIAFRGADQTLRRVTMTKRAVTIPSVSTTKVFDLEGRRVGYVFFRNFVRPSFDALDKAFATLKEARVDDLVLDLRYNGGGLVDVAQHLVSLIGGLRTEGQVFAESFHNDRYATFNSVTRFETIPNALALPRLVVITTRASASASELVINALRPFIPVVVIGERTYGKPVGQYGIPFCDKLIAPVAFTLRNADGYGDFFDGFAADCPAPDDIDHALGDAEEGSLREALTFVRTGACSPPPPAPLRRQLPEPARATGWHAVVGAH
jgi:C-terminal peptidase prc